MIYCTASWSGDYPLTALGALPAAQRHAGLGYIDTQPVFQAVWAAFKPGEPVPEVNFSTDLVVYVRNTRYYNRTRIFKVLRKDGVAQILAMETMSAIPIDDMVAMAMAVVAREGIASIQSGDTTLNVE